jgi:hypothetical protein
MALPLKFRSGQRRLQVQQDAVDAGLMLAKTIRP